VKSLKRKRDLAEERVSEVMEDLEVMEGQTIWYATCKREKPDVPPRKILNLLSES
jgi:hypothetical protein